MELIGIEMVKGMHLKVMEEIFAKEEENDESDDYDSEDEYE